MTSENAELPKRPGESMRDWQLFEITIGIDGKQKGFHTPDGEYYFLGEDEEILFQRKPDGDQDVIIRKDLSLEQWKEGYQSPAE